MKVNPDFRLIDVCGQHILIAEGKENIDYSNIISMNDSSKLLWDSIQDKAFTTDDLAHILMDNYQIDDDTPLSYEQAAKDASALVKQWMDAGIIAE